MGLLWWVFAMLSGSSTSVLFVLSFGILSAAIFGIVVTTYERWRWGRLTSAEMPDLKSLKNVLLVTPAFHGSNVGWLALTDDGLHFKVKSSNYKDMRIRFSEINAIQDWMPVGSSGAGIQVNLVSGDVERFEVQEIGPWRRILTTFRKRKK